MNKTIKIALAGMLAASSLSGVALAQTMAPMGDDGVSIIRADSLNKDDTRGEYEGLQLKATDATQVQAAQAEVESDPNLASALAAENLQVAYVIDVVTAADGSKIVYVR